MRDAKNKLISSYVDFAKSSIERQCEKLKKKNKNLEKRLEQNLCEENYDSLGYYGFNYEKENEKLSKKIKRYEEKIEALKMSKLSLEIINFQDF